MDKLLGKYTITGYKYAERIERVFASYLVDVAYIEEMNDDFVIAVPDDCDNKNVEYLYWVKRMIEETISKHCGETIRVEIF